MIPYLLQQFKKRRLARKELVTEELKRFYQTEWKKIDAPLYELPLVSLDFETTGLNPKKDEIISIGLVEINQMSIDLSTAWHQLIKPEKSMPESSVIIHQISDTELKKGLPMEKVLPELIRRITGKVLLVHCRKIEAGFLNYQFKKHYGIPFIAQMVDTMQLAAIHGRQRNKKLGLRLYQLREHYHLPAYKAHNALLDAVATGELLFAQIGDYYPQHPPVLQQIIYY